VLVPVVPVVAVVTLDATDVLPAGVYAGAPCVLPGFLCRAIKCAQ
jgi:hypothetical protein